MSNKKLRLARKKIDIVDRSIFNIIKKRTHIVKHMLSLKQFKSQIIDRKRINEIIYSQNIATQNVFNSKKIPFRSFEIFNKDEILPIILLVNAVFSSLVIKLAVPSAVFKATFPVNPSVTITLTSPSII